MRPTRHGQKPRPPGLGIRFIELVEAGIGVGVQEARHGPEQRLGVLALAVGGIAVKGGRRLRGAPGSLVAHDDPQSSVLRASAAGVLNRDRRVVGMDGGAGAGVVADPFRHRLQQPGGAPDPVGER